MNKVFLDLSYPKNCPRPEWKKAMERVREGKDGLIHLVENRIQSKATFIKIMIWGTRVDINTWLDLLLESNPNVALEVLELKRAIRRSFIQNHVNEYGEYIITLGDLKRKVGTSEGIIAKPWFWERAS